MFIKFKGKIMQKSKTPNLDKLLSNSEQVVVMAALKDCSVRLAT